MWSLLPARAHETQVALRRSESRGADSPGRKGIWGSVRVGGKVVHCRPGARATAFFRATPLTSTIIPVARSGGNRTERDFRRGGGEMPSLPVADARACALGAGRGLGECTNHEAGVVAKALGLLERTSCATQKPKPPRGSAGALAPSSGLCGGAYVSPSQPAAGARSVAVASARGFTASPLHQPGLSGPPAPSRTPRRR